MTLTLSAEDLAARFGVDEGLVNFEARYNICPGQDVKIITEREGVRTIRDAQWGLVPQWATTPNSGPRPINAKCEGIEASKMWGYFVKNRRCLIPSSGFYEWAGEKPNKVPYYITLKDKQPFAFAGLFSVWRSKDPDVPMLVTCAVITVAANELLWPADMDKAAVRIHHRMPAILDPEDEDLWLEARAPMADVLDCLRPYPPDLMKAIMVSKKVNKAGTEGEDLIEPVE